jgi:hypothetical protein
MNIEDKIDEYVNKVSMVGKKMEKNTFFSDDKQYYYKDKNDLIRILSNLYKDDAIRELNNHAEDIIDLNKAGKIAYIGSNPYYSELYNEEKIQGVFDSKKELERQQHEAAQDI